MGILRFLQKSYLILCVALPCAAGFSQTAGAGKVALTYKGSRGYSLVERTDLRRYINGKYTGLTSRELRSYISPSSAPQDSRLGSGQWYDGSFYILEKTQSNGRSTASGIHDTVPSVFHISPSGKLTMYEDHGYPSFRSFPAFASSPVTEGDSWKASAERSVDPLNKGVFTRIPMEVLYTFAGAEVYNGMPVYRIKAMWQTYYGATHHDFSGDQDLIRALGGHKAEILVLQQTGVPIMVRDTVDETFIYADGNQVNFKGTISLFMEFPPAVDYGRLMPALQRIAAVQPGTGSSGTGTVDAGKYGTGGGTGGAGAVKVAAVPSDAGGAGATGVAGGAGATRVAGGAGATGVAGGMSGIGTGAGASGTVGKYGGSSGRTAGVGSGTAVSGTAGSGRSSAMSAPVKEAVTTAAAKNDMVVEQTPAGLRLSVRNIRFKPDSDEILPSEYGRLDEIAGVLVMAKGSQFLIEGHTARVGAVATEQPLSLKRAHKIAEELSARGVASSAFLCRGFGGARPVASNDTEEGRAQNRRVEITILE